MQHIDGNANAVSIIEGLTSKIRALPCKKLFGRIDMKTTRRNLVLHDRKLMMEKLLALLVHFNLEAFKAAQ